MPDIERPDQSPSVEQVTPPAQTDDQDRTENAYKDATTVEKRVPTKTVYVSAGSLTLRPPEEADTTDGGKEGLPKAVIPKVEKVEKTDAEKAREKAAEEARAKQNDSNAKEKAERDNEAKKIFMGKTKESKFELRIAEELMSRSGRFNPADEKLVEDEYNPFAKLFDDEGRFVPSGSYQDRPVKVNKLYINPNLKILNGQFQDNNANQTRAEEEKGWVVKLLGKGKSDEDAEGKKDSKAVKAEEKKEKEEKEEAAKKAQEASKDAEQREKEKEAQGEEAKKAEGDAGTDTSPEGSEPQPPAPETAAEAEDEREVGQRSIDALKEADDEDSSVEQKAEEEGDLGGAHHIPIPFTNGNMELGEANSGADGASQSEQSAKGPEVDLGAIGDYAKQVGQAYNKAVAKHGMESPVTQGLAAQQARAERLFSGEAKRMLNGGSSSTDTPPESQPHRREIFKAENKFLDVARVDPNSSASKSAYDTLVRAEKTYKTEVTKAANVIHPVRVSAEHPAELASRHLDVLMRYDPATVHISTHVEAVTTVLTGNEVPITAAEMIVHNAVRQALTAVYADGQYIYPPSVIDTVRESAWQAVGTDYEPDTLVEVRTNLNALGESVGAGVNTL